MPSIPLNGYGSPGSCQSAGTKRRPLPRSATSEWWLLTDVELTLAQHARVGDRTVDAAVALVHDRVEIGRRAGLQGLREGRRERLLGLRVTRFQTCKLRLVGGR